MEKEILFEEVQGSGKKGVRDFFRATSLIFLVALAFNLVMHRANVSWLTTALFTGLVLCIVVSFVVYTRLITQVRPDGIYVRFPPFQPSFNQYKWEDILDVYIRNYDALPEYNGWGIRWGVMGKGYILPGNTGIQIIFKDKTRLLVTTHRPDEVSAVLHRLRQV